MKKLLAGALLISSPMLTMAAGGHGPAGCGLGTEVVFQDANEWHEHVLAATTNGTSGNQTFGMTSGTLGCESAGGPLAKGTQEFIDGNIDRLAAEIAVGHGESLDALQQVIGVRAEQRAHFTALLRDNFGSLFTSHEVNSGQLHNAIVKLMRSDSAMSAYVS
ncbi:MAG: DUF3015 domain-containing protein [Gammaproteobacteria bacterium]|nr:DUF3015 domain-containing protein [Gammaproteobacteria bacterium]NNM11564.1 DUF3015 domain-containing protein [Pseudomonadales bacterium]